MALVKKDKPAEENTVTFISKRYPLLKCFSGGMEFCFKDGALKFDLNTESGKSGHDTFMRDHMSPGKNPYAIMRVDPEAAKALIDAHLAAYKSQNGAQAGAMTSKSLVENQIKDAARQVQAFSKIGEE